MVISYKGAGRASLAAPFFLLHESFMVHPEDLDAFGRIAGHRTLTPEFEAEYGLWLKMYHRNKGQGGLGHMMIPLMRSMDIGPKAEAERTEGRIDWSKVQPMTRVLVQTDTGPRYGCYVGLRDYGVLAIRYDGDPMIRQAPPINVTLLADEPAPLPPESPVDEPQRFVEGDPSAVVSEEEIADYDPAEDTVSEADLPEPPKFEDKEWYTRSPGSRVVVQNGDDTAEGQLVTIGPGDGQITVWLDEEDEQRTFAEVDVFAG